MYISLTHNDENRFGGGNNSKLGLKDDGKELLNYLNNKQIAVDLSHTSDALAHDIINQINKHNLNLPVIASHSNSRSVFNHVRNLPDELISEIVDRKGLIGINFLRAFVNYETPHALIDHIEHLQKLGCSKVLSFGADFFYTFNHPDPNRFPFYFSEHMNATKYQDILKGLGNFMSDEDLSAIAYKNFTNFIQRLYAAGRIDTF
jgi:microsomal dipeptidase-like Zn-dependent dipeptidase